MKKFEIKKMGAASVFKTMIYMMIIPSALLIAIGFIMFLIGIIMGQPEVVFMGLFFAILYPLLLVGVYVGLATLSTLIYNLCAGKFGGLKLYVDETDDENKIV